MSLVSLISSEIRLRNYERDTVENLVRKLVDKAYNNLQIRTDLGLLGTMTFKSHTNLSKTNDSLSKHIHQIFIKKDNKGQTPPNYKSQHRAQGKGNQMDQFCIHRTSNGRNIPAIAIKSKAPHKLRRNKVITGLASEIQPERNVINKDGNSFTFTSNILTTAIITQLFSYMISTRMSQSTKGN
ncbi:uncharacterized protein ColSpa_11971 [Colletotrichum spaethianum]|uniref:Uncharacterized protein n=1 Tax=Colletotrichum spaethianum TaxID=700344 RepID=A0AA37PGT7_9PEZI|nr:uncharacterized protein ColSpa_11971 [Colletotrichum spaethianum]GKT51790.1 hypothetical protein ColSpa_11971 [Colletotrichum spaethianum]